MGPERIKKESCTRTSLQQSASLRYENGSQDKFQSAPTFRGRVSFMVKRETKLRVPGTVRFKKEHQKNCGLHQECILIAPFEQEDRGAF